MDGICRFCWIGKHLNSDADKVNPCAATDDGDWFAAVRQPEHVMHRRVFAIAGALLIAVTGVWAVEYNAAATRPHTPPSLTAGTPYVVTSVHNGAAFDLNIRRHERYLLIVGNLSGAEVEHSIRFTAAPVAAATDLRLSPLQPLAVSLRPRPVADRIDVAASLNTERDGIETRAFFIPVTDGDLDDPRSYQAVQSNLIAEGRQVRVYLDADQTERELFPGVVAELIRLFDDEIYPESRRNSGAFFDVDADGKFAILLTHWLGKLQGGRTAVGGFVRGSDFSPSIAPPFGNRADVLYLNSNTASGPQLKTLLAHEYTHAVLFSARRRLAGATGAASSEEDWLNEAIAHMAENRLGCDWSNLDHRIHAFLENPARSPLVVADYYRAGRWRDHGCRGATYLFLRWCTDTFGEDVIPRLINSPLHGRANLAQATGLSFEELFRRWSIALAQPRERYRYLSLQGRIGDFELQGVSRNRWDLDDREMELPVCGTACRFVELASRQNPGCFHITVSGPPASRLQLTLVKLPHDEQMPHRPQPQLAAR